MTALQGGLNLFFKVKGGPTPYNYLIFIHCIYIHTCNIWCTIRENTIHSFLFHRICGCLYLITKHHRFRNHDSSLNKIIG
uniref:Uncharacterized protein n=1 Tax=Anguilla anguilla TaxID=7936 RepID=A0A0E9RPA6_ANGAN